MILFINGYSFVAFALLALIFTATLTWKFANPQWTLVAAALTVVALVLFQINASTKENTVSNVVQFDDALASGKPVLLQLYSNF